MVQRSNHENTGSNLNALTWTRQEPTNSTRQLGKGTYQATKKLTTMSNFKSL